MGPGRTAVKRLYQAGDLPEAYLLRDRLRRAGIAAEVFNEHAAGALGEIPFTHAYPEVWVADEDWAAARASLAEFSAVAPQADWTCPACGETNPGSFESCWRCGAERPASGVGEN